MTAEPAAPPPTRIGRYLIEAELGRGMMGVIYKATDPDLGRTVALKTVALAFAVSEEDREAFRRRFLEEARIAARLAHPGIVVVHEVGRDPETGLLYMALEYLRGRTLSQIMASEGPLAWQEALRIGARVAEALHHAHQEGVVHRDIKPANIMVLDTGETKLLDFGVAKAPTLQLTAAGQFFGTPAYMSPEQACGLPVDGRSDLFSLGCVLYQAMTGQTPFTADNVPLLLSRILHDEPPLPSSLVTEIPAEVDVLMRRLLAKDREMRYADGRALAEDVEAILDQRPMQPLPARAPASSREPPAQEHAEESLQDARDATLDLRLSFLLDEDPAVDAPIFAPRRPVPSIPPPARPPAGRGRKWLGPSVLVGAAAATMAGVFLLAMRSGLGTAPGAPSGERQAVGPFGAAHATGKGADAPTGAEPVAEPLAATTGQAAGSARLALRFDHHLRNGTLRAWVDDALRLEQPLRAQGSRSLLLARVYRGRVAETVAVSPGRHRIRVEVAWEGRRASAQTVGQFEPGATRRLEVTVGMLRKTVELHWR